MRIALLLLSLILFGCTSAPAPSALQRTGGEWRTLYVVNHGLHTGLVIARTDLLEVLPGLAETFGEGDFIELGWGDEDYYRAAQPTLGLALQALFWPTASALHVLAIGGDPRQVFAGSELIEVRVAEDGYRQLLGFVAARFARSSAGALTELGPGQYDRSRFYRAEGRYSMLYTCNTWVAEALATGGCPLAFASAATAGQVMARLRQATTAGAACLAAP
jgi:uncharacterized protein (TIGR02117 family)